MKRLELLSPTLDIVFKMLLLSDERLLRSMVEAVLRLPEPLAAITVLNPEIPSHSPEHHGVVLDIRARLANGEEIDLEMATRADDELPPRLLYYWSRHFSSQLLRGAEYKTLVPLRQIVWSVRPFLPNVARFHEKFRLVGEHTGEPFAPHLEIHVLDLSRLRAATPADDARLLRWARFLMLEDDEHATVLAEEDAIMSLAVKKLHDLSSDPVARRIADDRERDLLAYGHTIASARDGGIAIGKREGIGIGIAIGKEEGIAIGKEEGIAIGKEEGIAIGIIRSIEALAAALGVELTSPRRDELSTASIDVLQARLASLAKARDWV